MKTYDWTSFTRKIAVKASLTEIYDAWTKAEEIEKWFLSKAVFFDEKSNPINPETNLQKGGTYQWNWYLYEGTEYGEIIEANGKNFIQFKFAGECLVDIELSEHKESVIVKLTQKNIPTDEESKRSIRLGCDFGWFFYMLNLKSVYEGGLDLRNKDSELGGMLNN